MKPLDQHPDRFFDSDPAVRKVARNLYASVAELPLVCPHGHVPPALMADDQAFAEPASLLIRPDHYIFRMLYSQGVTLESLGIPTRKGSSDDADPRRCWECFASHYHLFYGTPTRAWLDYVFYFVFGLRNALDADSARWMYDAIQERLQDAAFRPRALFRMFNIEVLATTDAASDDLAHHATIRDSEWDGRVIPCFRPDAAIRIAHADWKAEIQRMEELTGVGIGSYHAYIRALEDRRAFFKTMGATATDHAVLVPYTERLTDLEAERLFQKALKGKSDPQDQARFEAHMLMAMARMSTEDGLVMQLHPGSGRDHNTVISELYGSDKGADIPVATEYTRNLRALLNAYGRSPRLTLVVFTLDESTYTRELAPLAGHYPAMRLGPAWWFHDSIEGMRRFRERTTETAGIYNTAGFNDDTRAFLSIPARHDLARRVDANYFARLVARHQVEEDQAYALMRAVTYDLAMQTYKLHLTP